MIIDKKCNATRRGEENQRQGGKINSDSIIYTPGIKSKAAQLYTPLQVTKKKKILSQHLLFLEDCQTLTKADEDLPILP